MTMALVSRKLRAYLSLEEVSKDVLDLDGSSSNPPVTNEDNEWHAISGREDLGMGEAHRHRTVCPEASATAR